MGPVFLISLALSGLAFSFVKGVPLAQSKALAIQKEFETHCHQVKDINVGKYGFTVTIACLSPRLGRVL